MWEPQARRRPLVLRDVRWAILAVLLVLTLAGLAWDVVMRLG